jgi:uncharacterized SAM-binding protein YcdF (DUF218 family)
MVAGFAVLSVFSNAWVAATLIGLLENQYPAKTVETLPQADAIVVLGGFTLPPLPPRPYVDVGEGFDRLLHGMRLWRAGKAPRLVLAGGAFPMLVGSEMTEAHAMQILAREYGIPRTALILEEYSRNTYENALGAQRVLAPFNVRRLLLVTSASHMPRAMAVFSQLPYEIVPASTDVRVVNESFNILNIIPKTSALLLSSIALKEYVGLLYYWMRGWV